MNGHDLMGPGRINRIGQMSYETLRCEQYSSIEIIAETKNMHAENLPEHAVISAELPGGAPKALQDFSGGG